LIDELILMYVGMGV